MDLIKRFRIIIADQKQRQPGEHEMSDRISQVSPGARSSSRRGRPTAAEAKHKNERILAAATAAFVAHGMQASIEAIAQVAGVSKPTLYARYPDRLALFEAVLGQLHRNRPNMDTVITAEMPLATALERYARALLPALTSPEVGAFYRFTLQGSPLERQARRVMIRDFNAAFVSPLVDYLHACASSGTVGAGIDATTAARMFVYQVIGLIDYHVATRDSRAAAIRGARHELASVIAIFIGGLRPRADLSPAASARPR